MSTLNQNTTNLQTVLDTTNSIRSDIATAITNKGVSVPDGTTLDGMAALIDGIESGGSVETCTVTYRSLAGTCWYIDASMTYTQTSLRGSGTLTVAKNTFVTTGAYILNPTVSGGVVVLSQNAFAVTDDGTIMADIGT